MGSVLKELSKIIFGEWLVMLKARRTDFRSVSCYFLYCHYYDHLKRNILEECTFKEKFQIWYMFKCNRKEEKIKSNVENYITTISYQKYKDG